MFNRRILFFALCVSASFPGTAAENKYDVLGKALTPFVHLLAAKSPSANRAVTLSLRIESATELPTEWSGARADVALEYPDKLRIRGPIAGEELTVCRNGEEIWVSPAEKAEALFNAASSERKLPPLDKKYRLEPFGLPVPEKQLVFFPALFQITDRGEESLDEMRCRVLDVTLMPELARSLEVTEWVAQLWVSSGQPVRLTLARPGWQITIRIAGLRFTSSLPESTWQPEHAGEVMKISAPRYQQLLKSIGGARRPPKKLQR